MIEKIIDIINEYMKKDILTKSTHTVDPYGKVELFLEKGTQSIYIILIKNGEILFNCYISNIITIGEGNEA